MSSNQAGVCLNDIGVLRGYGVFDFLRTYNGKPFLLREHLSRLEQSAKLLNLKIPTPQSEIKTIINKLLRKNKFKDAEIRIVLTGGKTTDAINCGSKPTLFILVERAKTLPLEVVKTGVKLITFEHQRELPQAKTTNYITAVRLQDQRRKRGAFEILYTWRGYIREATTSNFFIFRNNALITPGDDILIGATRNFVINLAQNKFKIQERAIPLRELRLADEAFITATNKEIVPVIKIDNQRIGKGEVGGNTKYLIGLFREHVSKF